MFKSFVLIKYMFNTYLIKCVLSIHRCGLDPGHLTWTVCIWTSLADEDQLVSLQIPFHSEEITSGWKKIYAPKSFYWCAWLKCVGFLQKNLLTDLFSVNICDCPFPIIICFTLVSIFLIIFLFFFPSSPLDITFCWSCSLAGWF